MSKVIEFLRRIAGKPEPRPTFGRPIGEGGRAETFGKDLLQEFLAGEVALRVNSSWLDNALWHPDTGELQITFRDGHVAYYRPWTREELISFAVARSKGEWVHTYILAGRNEAGGWNHIKNYRPGG